jgi:hypothetical protein
MNNLNELREKLIRQGYIVDIDPICNIVVMGDHIFSERVLLTALLKCNDEIKTRILRDVELHDFTYGWRLIFEWVSQSLKETNKVEVAELYRKMESYVRSHDLQSYKTFLDQVLKTETPNLETLQQAITQARQEHSAKLDLESERVILAALINGNAEMQAQAVSEINVETDIQHLVHEVIFEWVKELLQLKGRVDHTDLYQAMERYVTDQILPTYTALLDHVISIDTPDDTTIDHSISWIHKTRRKGHVD